MVGMSGLWMPILLSAVAVFVASSLIHMVIGWHKAEYKGPPNEIALGDAMRPFNLPPGEYQMPWCPDMKQMGTPEFQERIKKGPNVTLMVRSNENVNMGKQLGLWFAYCLVVSAVVAFAAGRYLPQGMNYRHVFKLAAIVSFAAYTMGTWQSFIWFGKSMRYTITTTLDGLIYAGLTAGIFGWLWPR